MIDLHVRFGIADRLYRHVPDDIAGDLFLADKVDPLFGLRSGSHSEEGEAVVESFHGETWVRVG